jgi:hypothetical protein
MQSLDRSLPRKCFSRCNTDAVLGHRKATGDKRHGSLTIRITGSQPVPTRRMSSVSIPVGRPFSSAGVARRAKEVDIRILTDAGRRARSVSNFGPEPGRPFLFAGVAHRAEEVENRILTDVSATPEAYLFPCGDSPGDAAFSRVGFYFRPRNRSRTFTARACPRPNSINCGESKSLFTTFGLARSITFTTPARNAQR